MPLVHLVLLVACADGTSSPQRIDSERLAAAYERARQVPGMKSLLVAQGGTIVAEEYFNGSSPDDLHDVRSVTKSVTSALIGIAIREGFIASVDETLADYLGSIVEGLDEDWAGVTVENLLTMRAGHIWHELGGVSEFGDWMRAPDHIEYIVEKPIVHPPGTRFNYSDGSAHLVSVVLSQATGMSAAAFAEQYLFGPLGIGERHWLTDNRGYNLGGVGVQVSARDMLAFGTLYLNGGASGESQIVPADWVATSTEAHVATNEAVPYGFHYGYLWWLGQAAGRDFYFATGYGGQFIVNVPDLDLVVVATCEWWGMGEQAGQNWYEIMTLIVEDVLPAVRR